MHHWKNWSPREDLDSLGQWEGLFGVGFRGLLLFAYNIVGDRAPLPADELFEHRGALYGFVGVELGDYALVCRPISPRWGHRGDADRRIPQRCPQCRLPLPAGRLTPLSVCCRHQRFDAFLSRSGRARRGRLAAQKLPLGTSSHRFKNRCYPLVNSWIVENSPDTMLRRRPNAVGHRMTHGRKRTRTVITCNSWEVRQMARLGFMMVAFSLLAQTAMGVEDVSVTSPDGRIALVVSVDQQGRLTYQLSRGDVAIVEPSPLGLTADAVHLGRGVSLGQPERTSADETYSTRGVHPEARNHYNGAKIPVTHTKSKTKYTLEVRVFNDGAGFRYLLPGEHELSGEDTAFQLPGGATIWGQTNTKSYEGLYEKYAIAELKADTYFGPPVVAKLTDGTYAAVSETALFNYSGMSLRAVGDGSRRLAAAFEDDKKWTPTGEVVSPWRVVFVSSDLDGLVNSDIITNLNEPPLAELTNADWIRPGRGFWHWWSEPRRSRGARFEDHPAWIDYASQFNFEYYLVDVGWERRWRQPGKDKWELLHELTDYAAKKNVKIWVWRHWKPQGREFHPLPGLDNAEFRRDYFRRVKQAGGRWRQDRFHGFRVEGPHRLLY